MLTVPVVVLVALGILMVARRDAAPHQDNAPRQDLRDSTWELFDATREGVAESVLPNFRYPRDWFIFTVAGGQSVRISFSDGGTLRAQQLDRASITQRLSSLHRSGVPEAMVYAECRFSVVRNDNGGESRTMKENHKVDRAERDRCDAILAKLEAQLPEHETSKTSSKAVRGWQTYRHEVLGYSISYPTGWDVEEYLSGGVTIGASGRGMVVDIRMEQQTLEEFIGAYNVSDLFPDGTPRSSIYHQEVYATEHVSGHKLLGSTAIGITRGLLFIPRGDRAIVVTFNEDDPDHHTIVKTLQFLESPVASVPRVAMPEGFEGIVLGMTREDFVHIRPHARNLDEDDTRTASNFTLAESVAPDSTYGARMAGMYVFSGGILKQVLLTWNAEPKIMDALRNTVITTSIARWGADAQKRVMKQFPGSTMEHLVPLLVWEKGVAVVTASCTPTSVVAEFGLGSCAMTLFRADNEATQALFAGEAVDEHIKENLFRPLSTSPYTRTTQHDVRRRPAQEYGWARDQSDDQDREHCGVAHRGVAVMRV